MTKRKSKFILYVFLTFLVLALPIPLFALLVMPNEYSIVMGIEGAVDCDGPGTVMLLAISSYVIYGLGGCILAAIAIRKKIRLYGYLAIICLLFVAIITPNVVKAYIETKKPVYIQSCGEGW
jgi:hypothetical protein